MTKWLDRLSEIQKVPGLALTEPTQAPSVSSVTCQSKAFQNFGSTPENGNTPNCQLPKLPEAPTALLTIEGARAEYRRRRQLGYSATQAHSLAYGAALDDWHRQHGEKMAPGRCAGCGEPLRDGDNLHSLPDGARVHATGNDCLIAYGVKWQRAARAGLARLGINPPAGYAE